MPGSNIGDNGSFIPGDPAPCPATSLAMVIFKEMVFAVAVAIVAVGAAELVMRMWDSFGAPG